MKSNWIRTGLIAALILFMAAQLQLAFQDNIPWHPISKQESAKQEPSVSCPKGRDVSGVVSFDWCYLTNHEAEWWTAISTVILGLATIFLCLVTGALVKGSEDTAKKQLRAYVSAWPHFIVAFNATNFSGIKFRITNHGQTPAYKFRHRADVVVCPHPLPAEYTFPAITTGWSAPSVIFPNAKIPEKERFSCNARASRLFTSAEISGIRNGTLKLYAIGQIEYKDNFDKPQWTTFCASITADTKNLKHLTSIYPKDDLVIVFGVAPTGNDAS